MIDHLMRFTDEATAKADPVVGRYWAPASDDGPGSWRGDVCIPGVSVYTPNEDGSRTLFTGWFIVIALPTLDPSLRDLPGNACRLIADRDAADAGQSFIRYTAADLEPGILSMAKVEPTFAGSNYPFGATP